MAKTILSGLAIVVALAGCIQTPEQASCIRIAQYVANQSGAESAPLPVLTDHEQLIGDGMRLRGVGNFKQHAYLEAYSVCKSLEAGNGFNAGRL